MVFEKGKSRKKLLADKLFLIKYIEQWGRGTNRVMEEMKENNLPEPEFQNLSGGFEVTLIGPGKAFEKEIEKQKLHTLEINERQQKAIEYVKKNESITTRDYIELNRIAKRYSVVELNDLINKGILKRMGKGRATYYILVHD